MDNLNNKSRLILDESLFEDADNALKIVDFQKEFNDYLEKHDFYERVYPGYYDNKEALVCEILWGDWKHDHAYFDDLAVEFFLEKNISVIIKQIVTEEDGSDTYSSDHYIILDEPTQLFRHSQLFEHTETIAGPEHGPDAGISAMLIEAINEEWRTIDHYNSIAIMAKQAGKEDIARVIEHINMEENKHVGELQEALKLVSPNTEVIEMGKEEGKEELASEQVLDDNADYYVEAFLSDSEYDDDFEFTPSTECLDLSEENKQPHKEVADDMVSDIDALKQKLSQEIRDGILPVIDIDITAISDILIEHDIIALDELSNEMSQDKDNLTVRYLYDLTDNKAYKYAEFN